MELVEEASGVGESGGEPGSCQAFTIIVIQNSSIFSWGSFSIQNNVQVGVMLNASATST